MTTNQPFFPAVAALVTAVRKNNQGTHKKTDFPDTHSPIPTLVHTATHSHTCVSTHMLTVRSRSVSQALTSYPLPPGLTWAHPGSWLPMGPGRFGSRGWHRHHSATRRWGRRPPRAWHLERQSPPSRWAEILNTRPTRNYPSQPVPPPTPHPPSCSEDNDNGQKKSEKLRSCRLLGLVPQRCTLNSGGQYVS